MTRAAGSPGEKSRNRSSWPRIAATFRLERRRGRAGSAPTTGPTGRRSCPSRHRRARPGAHRSAAAGAARRSGRGGRCGASRSRRVEADVAAIGRSVASRAASPGVVACEDPPPAQLVEQRRTASPAAPRGAPSQGRASSRLDEAGGQLPFVHAPYAIVRPQMQTSSRAAPAPSTGAPASAARTEPASTFGRIVVVVLVLLLLTTGARRGHRRRRCRGRLQPLRRRPPRPGRTARRTSSSSSRRSSTTGPARSSSPASATSSASSSPSSRLPGEIARRDDRHRGQGLLGEPGLRPGGHRVGRPRHGRGPAARRLDDHPAARPRATPAAGGVRGLDLRAQGARDHPVDPPDPGLPGRGGQEDDHHRLPQPELLRQPELRREGGGQELLRQVARGADPGPGRDPRRDPAVADQVRPHAQRRGGLPRRRRRRRGMHQVQARRPARLGDRPAPQQGPRPDEDAQPADRRASTRPPSTRSPRRSRSSSSSRSPPSGRRPISCGRSRRALGAMLCPEDPDRLPRGRHRRLQGHLDDRPEDAEGGREVGLRRRPGTERQEPVGDPEQPQDPALGTVLDHGPARAQHPQRGRRRHRLPDRRGPRLRRVGELHVQGQQEVPAAVRRPGRRLAAAGFGDQADQLRHRHRRQDPDRGDDVHGRHDELRWRLHPDPGRQARARPGPPPLGAPVLAQHPGHQGDDHQRPGPRLSSGPRSSASATRAPRCRSCRWASGRSRSIRSTCSAPTARSPTAAC